MKTPGAMQQALDEQVRRYRAALADGAQRIGWKLAFEIAEIEALIGARPCFGYLTSASRLDGRAFDSAGCVDLRVDCEVAIELASDIDPRADPNWIRKQIAGVATGLELVDVGIHRGSFHALIVNNVMHRAFAIGPLHPLPSHPRVEARCWVNGELIQQARAQLEFAEHIISVAHLLDLVGERLLAGDRILTGSQTQVPVTAGDEVEVEVDGFGKLGATIT